MRKKTTGWLITAGILVVLGLALFAAAMAAHGWNFTGLNTAKYETCTHEISDSFNSISLYTNTADIIFVPSENGTCSVTCYEPEYARHDVSVQDGTLTVREVNTREWYDNINITSETPRITLSLPDAEYRGLFISESTGDIEIPKDFRFERMEISASTGDITNRASASDTIKITTSTGGIRVENVSAAALDLSVSTGRVVVADADCTGNVSIHVSTGEAYLTDVTCENIFSDGNTGEIDLRNVLAAGKISIERSTGDVEFDCCDAAELFIQTDTGDVTGTLRSDKVFSTTTDTGDVDVPKSISGGICEIITNTGDIRINNQ